MSKQIPAVYRVSWLISTIGPYCVIERCNKDVSRSCPIWLPVISLEPLNNCDNLGEYDIEFLGLQLAAFLTEIDKNFTPRGKSNDVARQLI